MRVRGQMCEFVLAKRTCEIWCTHAYMCVVGCTRVYGCVYTGVYGCTEVMYMCVIVMQGCARVGAGMYLYGCVVVVHRYVRLRSASARMCTSV